MDTQANKSPQKKDIRSDLLARAKNIAPMIKQGAQNRESLRSVEPEIVETLRDSGILRGMQPARFGGHELDFTYMIDIAQIIGRSCGSTAWITNLYIVHHWLLATFPVEVQDEVFGEDPNVIICGSYAPAGKTEHVDGGYKVSGKFQFASGCDNATWSLMGVIIPPKDDSEKPNAGFALVPASDYTIDDNWHTTGLAATGSKNLIMDEAFVPQNRFVSFADLMSGSASGALTHNNPLYTIPFLGAIPICISSPALGMVQGALDEFVEQIGTRETRGAVKGGAHRLAEFEIIQSRLAEASAYLDAAELLLRRDCEEVMNIANNGEKLDIPTRIRNRRDHAFSVHLCVQAVEALFKCTGGQGLFLDNVVQRAWRDVTSASRHVSLNWDAVSTMYGQHILGLEPRGQY